MTSHGGMAPWLADIAANVLAMTLLVLIALGRFSAADAPPVPSELLTPREVAPLGGAAAVELLRQRLLPGAQGHLDVTGELVTPTSRPTVLFVLDPAIYPQAVAALAQQGTDDWQELTVPEALKTPMNQWDPAFLALATVANDPDRFRTALQILLVERSRSGPGKGVAAGSGAPPVTRFAQWFDRALDVMGLMALGLALWGLTRLHRWAITA